MILSWFLNGICDPPSLCPTAAPKEKQVKFCLFKSLKEGPKMATCVKRFCYIFPDRHGSVLTDNLELFFIQIYHQYTKHIMVHPGIPAMKTSGGLPNLIEPYSISGGEGKREGETH